MTVEHLCEHVEAGERPADSAVPAVQDHRHPGLGEQTPRLIKQLVPRIEPADLDVASDASGPVSSASASTR